MSNVIAFSTTASRGHAAIDRAVAAHDIENMLRLAFSPDASVQQRASRWLREICNVIIG